MSWKLCEYCVRGTCLFGKANRKARENIKGHRYYRPPRKTLKELLCTMPLNRPSASAPTASPSATGNSEWSLLHPLLWEHITATTWADGSERVTSSLLMFCEERCVKLMLNNRAEEKVAFIASDSIEGAWAALETGLEASTLDWRKSKTPKKR